MKITSYWDNPDSGTLAQQPQCGLLTFESAVKEGTFLFAL